MAKDGHFVTRVVDVDCQLWFHYILRSAHTLYTRLLEKYNERGIEPKRVFVCYTIVGPNDNHVFDWLVCICYSTKRVDDCHKY